MLALALQAWTAAQAIGPGPRGWFASTVITVLGLVLLCATALAARRAVGGLQVQLAAQGVELRRLTLMAEHSLALIVLSDAEDRVLWANAAFLEVTGWRLAELQDQPADRLFTSPAADPALRLAVREAVASRSFLRQEGPLRTHDHHDLWLDIELRPLPAPATTPRDGSSAVGFARVCIDLGLRQAQQAKLQALWAALPSGVLVHDAGGRIVEANPVAEQVLGQSLAELRLRDAADPRWHAVRTDLSPIAAADHPAQRVLRTGRSLHGETLGVHTPAGALRWLSLNATPQRDRHGRVVGAVSCFADVTEQHALKAQAQQRAAHQAPPRLADHAALLLRLEQALAHLQRHPGYGFAVLCLGFESEPGAPDTPAARSEKLRQIAARLLELLRPGDVVAHGGEDPDMAASAAAYAEDSFVVVLDGVGDEPSLAGIVARLHRDLSQRGLAAIDGVPVSCSVSLGVAPCNQADELLTAPDLLRRAQLALAASRLEGAAGWRFFDAAEAEHLVQDQAQHSELRRALAEGEISVLYQPVVRLADGALTGAEALLRWRHPTRGWLPPLAFIGLAESGGLGTALGDAVWLEACTQFMRWQRTLGALAPPQVSVNLSAAQLERPGLADRIAAVLQESGMRPQQLQVEFTEGQIGCAALAELKALGVRLALDDFGSGHASLARLHGAAVDLVKIDGMLVRHSGSRDNHRMLVEATVSVAAERGMATLAEGIETAEQAALMSELGCGQGQGFLFSRPMAADAFTAWAQAARAVPAVATPQLPGA